MFFTAKVLLHGMLHHVDWCSLTTSVYSLINRHLQNKIQGTCICFVVLLHLYQCFVSNALKVLDVICDVHQKSLSSGLPGGAVVKGAVLQRQLCHQSPWVRAQALS